MNFQSSQSTSTPSRDQDASRQIEFVRESLLRLRWSMGAWVIGATVGFCASLANVSDATVTFFQHAAVVCASFGLVAAGRWLQGMKTLSWLHAQSEVPRSHLDWSDIPPSGGASEIRLFSSVQEATERGWEVGPPLAMFDGAPVPSWMECDGRRYVYDGLSGSGTPAFIPDNLRVFGRLRFLAPAEPDSKAVSASREKSASTLSSV